MSPDCVCGHPASEHSWIEAYDELDYCHTAGGCPCEKYRPSVEETP